MKDDIVISANEVSMKFNLNKQNVMSLKEYLVRMAKRQLEFEEFWALRDVSFEVKRGEIIGIIGSNGAGKSTLLRVLSGIIKPSLGKIRVDGSIAPLIELGAGFDFDLTARENVFLNGAILGYSQSFMKEKYEEIVDFSELQEFIDVPLKNYSSGMVARIGFAIATIVNADILIVDEILSVGDMKFQQKCEDRIHELFKQGTTVVIVSHSLKQIQELCSRVIWLEHGRIKMQGDPCEVCEIYQHG